MKYGSICSGVEAATLAWRPLDWKAVFFAEVEPFPSAVLCYRFKATRPLRPLDPAMADNEKERKTRELWRRQIAALPEDGTIPNFGDFTLIKKEDVNEDIDLLSRRSSVLDELVVYAQNVELQDSLQNLAAMSEDDRNKAIQKIIDDLIKKEKEEAEAHKKRTC